MNTAELEALGEELRAARAVLALTPLEVEQKIHVRAKFIEALELGAPDLLPSPVQARGFLRNYARLLGLDPDFIVLRWDEALVGGRRRRVKRATLPAQPVTAKLSDPRRTTGQTAAQYSAAQPPRPRRSLLVTLLAAIGIFAIVGGAAAAVVSVASQASGSAETISPILSPIPAEVLTQAAPSLTPVPSITALPSPSPDLNAPTADEVAMQLTITQRTWLRVTVDAIIPFEGVAAPGTILQYRGRQINVRAANGAGVQAVVNSIDFGILGARGQIIDQTFTPDNLTPPSVIQPIATTSP